MRVRICGENARSNCESDDGTEEREDREVERRSEESESESEEAVWGDEALSGEGTRRVGRLAASTPSFELFDVLLLLDALEPSSR